MKTYTTTSTGTAISPSGYSLTAPAGSSHISTAQSQKTIYHILGEDLEVTGPRDADTSIAIATLNILGKPFHDELRKNGIRFCEEIEEYLKVRFRDYKIDSVLK